MSYQLDDDDGWSGEDGGYGEFVDRTREAMLRDDEEIEKFISDRLPPSANTLLRMLLANGLPLRDRSPDDDALMDQYYDAMIALETEFNDWAEAEAERRWDEREQESARDKAEDMATWRDDA